MSAHRRLVLAVLGFAALSGACQEKIVNIVSVASVQVSGGGSPLLPGGTVQLSATPKDDRSNTLSNRSVNWSSSNTGVATVSNGLVTAVAAGSATISAQIEGVSGSASVSVNNPVPTVASLSPNTITVGGVATQITVTGTNFVTGSVVLWNGTDRQTQFVSGTTLRVTVTVVDLAATGSFNVSVRNPTPGGGVSGTSVLTVVNPVPVLSSLSPATPPIGTGFELTVTGASFVASSVVLWNGQERTTTFVNATTLRAAITAADVAATGTFNVAVRSPAPGGGTSATLPLSAVNPVPVLTGITPDAATAGAAGFELTVTGSGYVAGSVVLWNGADRATQYVSASTLKASIPAADVASAGSANVTVRNPSPGGGTSGARTFAVNNPAPVISAISPDTARHGAAGLQLTVTGTGFTAGSTVRWNGQDRTTTFVSSTSLRAAIPASDLLAPALVAVTVFNPSPGGGSAAARSFEVRIEPPGPTVAASMYSSCAVRGSGEAYCWGSNSSGQVGDGSASDRAVPTRVASPVPFVSTVVGGNFGCGLTRWGAAYCWGGQTGAGGSSLTAVPVAGGHAFIQLTAGISHACGVTAAGAMYCWGNNYYGQLGNGSNTSTNLPVLVTGTTTWKRAFAAGSHTCAISTAGRLYCWGANFYGQLGDGSATDRSVPTAVSTSATFTTGAGGYGHSCAVTTGGSAYCWGYGGSGALGNNAWENSPTPVLVSGGNAFASLAGGSFHMCGVTRTGGVRCWGYGGSGQIGTGTYNSEPIPVTVTLAAVRDIAAGESHSCGVTTTGSVYCWGERAYGGLGDGVFGMRSSPVTVSGAGSGFTAAAAGEQYGCGLSGSSPRCWGLNDYNQLGDDSSVLFRTTPTAVAGGRAFASITPSRFHTCALTAAGMAYCWGANWYGQLGDGTYTSTRVPVAVTGGHVFAQLELGSGYTCGITTAGQVLCWGQNNYGQLGDGSTTDRTVPTPITGVPGLTFARVSAGHSHTCALASGDRRLYCWGRNSNSQLGNGTTTNSSVPVAVPVATQWATVTAGYYHTCALSTGNAAYCWGANYYGEAGVGGTSSSVAAPVLVNGGYAFTRIAAGAYLTCAVTAAGTAYCWGRNDWGQLGTGNTFTWPQPTPVVGGASYQYVIPGYQHTCAVTTGGAAQCWGRLHSGELGIGVAGMVPTPAQVLGGIVFGLADCPADGCAALKVLPTRSLFRLANPAASGSRWLPGEDPVPPDCDPAHQLCLPSRPNPRR